MTMRTQPNRWFDEYNARYWRGRLPSYLVIRGHKDGLLGWCRDKTRTIMLDRTLTGEDLELTLLHEMCHIGQAGAEHGPTFQRKLRRLLRLGAPARLLDDLERYDGSAIERYLASRTEKPKGMLFSVAVRSDLESMSFDREIARKRWVTIQRHLMREYNITAAQLRRACPWVARVWRELRAAGRQEEQGFGGIFEHSDGSETLVKEDGQVIRLGRPL